MTDEALSDEFVTWAQEQAMSARARVALDLMLKNGTVTTVELKNMGYNHPPRVLADLKDAGVPFQMTRVRVDGEPRPVAGYRLIDNVSATGEAARKPIPKWFKDQLLASWEYHCAICNGEYTARILQPDHRIPFRIGGDPDEWDETFFMPLCGSDTGLRVGHVKHVQTGTFETPPLALPAIGHHLTTMSTWQRFKNDGLP